MDKNHCDLFNPHREKRREIAENIERLCPSISRFSIGKSILGENIDTYRIGEGKRNILLVGAHHGSEHITSSVLYYFLLKIGSEREKNYGIDSGIYRKIYSLFVVPMLNPDGVELSVRGEYENPLKERQKRIAGGEDFTHWQANARGTDLNHNYSYGFEEYKRIEKSKGILPGMTRYSGEYPESEPESRALANLVRSVQFSLVVSLHSQGGEIYAFPKTSCENEVSGSVSRTSERLSRWLAGKLGYEIKIPTGTAAYGGFCDYTGEVLRIPSLTLEIGRGENPLPESEYYRERDKLTEALYLLPTKI